VIDLEWIRACVNSGKYYFSGHADIERQNDGLSIVEIEESLNNGIMLEFYEDTGRGESCLITGFTVSGKPIHVVIGRRGESPVIITTYIPTPPKFKNPYERG
jgi:hypothetical protein